MNNKSIFVTQPCLPPLDEFLPYLEQIWENKWLTNNGPLHQQLEQQLANYLGVKYISLFSNGTLALISALQALNNAAECFERVGRTARAAEVTTVMISLADSKKDSKIINSKKEAAKVVEYFGFKPKDLGLAECDD